MKLKFKWDARQTSLAIATALAMLGAVTPFTVHAPMWVGAVCAALAAGLNVLAHALHTNPEDTAPPGGAALLVLFVGGALLMSACGGSSASVRTAYAIESARCIANERAIVDRQGTTRAQDDSDLALERARCDSALSAIGGAP